MDNRKVSTKIALSEVPFIMRAMGFYPSEQEVGEVINGVLPFRRQVKSYIMSLMGFYPSEQEVGEVIYHVINGVLPFRRYVKSYIMSLMGFYPSGGRSSHISCH